MRRLDTPYTITDWPAHIAARLEAHITRIEREEREAREEAAAWKAKYNPETAEAKARREAYNLKKANAKRAQAEAAKAERVERIKARQSPARECLKLHPDWTDKRIAKELALDPTNVRKARMALIASGEIPHIHRRVGADGRTYAATAELRPPKPSPKLPRYREATAEALKLHPDWSTARIVTEFGLGRFMVENTRKRLVASGELPAERIGVNGRIYGRAAT